MAEQMDKARILNEMSTSYTALEEILTPLDKTQYFTKESFLAGQSKIYSLIYLPGIIDCSSS